ncbi:MAG: isochorismatase family cysteine hydrolase [Pseudomonadota bacterium]
MQPSIPKHQPLGAQQGGQTRLPPAVHEEFSTDRQVLPECEHALLIVDFINPLNFEGAHSIAEPALEAARATRALRERLAGEGVPVIYANDNYGLWQSNFRSMVAYCKELPGCVGEMTRLIEPGPRDIAILKPRHSAFYGTPLELLLDQMKVKKLILTGLATDICVQMSAMDAYLRAYETWVPADCCAAESAGAHEGALRYMKEVLRCRTDAAGRSPAQAAEGRQRTTPAGAMH